MRKIKRNLLTFTFAIFLMVSCILSGGKQNFIFLAKANALSLHELTRISSDDSEAYNETAKITVLTHGYDGNPSHFSNKAGKFGENSASIIAAIQAKTAVNGGIDLYRAEVNSAIFSLYQISSDDYDISNRPVSVINDASKHIVLVYEDILMNGGHEETYNGFENLLDNVSLQYKALTGKLPIYNLIGHSRGGIINLMYATEHPYNVDKVVSLGTPYSGSKLGMIDDILVFSKMLTSVDTPKPEGLQDILSEETAMDIRDSWNEVYAQGARANVISIGVMTDLTAVSAILQDESVGEYVEPNISKILSKVIEKADEIPAVTEFAFDFVAGVASVLQQFGVNTLTDLGFSPSNWTEVELGIYEEILELVQKVNGEIVIADDLFVDTDSQLGYGFSDGGSYNGFNRKVKILTSQDISGSRSISDQPPIGHNLETMNSDCVKCVGDNLVCGYGVNQIENIADEQTKSIFSNYAQYALQETENWLDYTLLKYEPSHSGSRKISADNAEVRLFVQNEDGTVGKIEFEDSFEALNGKTYYLQIKSNSSVSNVKILPADVISGNSVISGYDGTAAIALQPSTAGFYKLILPNDDYELQGDFIEVGDGQYAAYFEAGQAKNAYISGGDVSDLDLFFEPMQRIEKGVQLQFPNDKVRYLTNDTSETITYLLDATWDKDTTANFAVYRDDSVEVEGSVLSVGSSSYRQYLTFTLDGNSTACVVFEEDSVATYSLLEKNFTYEWYVDGEKIDGDIAYLSRIDKNRDVQMKLYIDGVLIDEGYSYSSGGVNTGTGSSFNLCERAIGSDFNYFCNYESEVYQEANGQYALTVIVIPYEIAFETINDDTSARFTMNLTKSDYVGNRVFLTRK